MTLQVETYEVVDAVASGEMEALAAEGEAAILIEELGLSGQQTLFATKEGEPAIHPYRAMTKEEKFVFSSLFPNTTKVEDYKDGLIPLRVLQIISHVRSLNRDDMAYIGVMHPEKFVDDPVLFAQQTYYSGTRYILARWGAALEPFETLKEKAIQKAAVIAGGKFREIIRDCQSRLEGLEDYVREELATGGDALPHYYK